MKKAVKIPVSNSKLSDNYCDIYNIAYYGDDVLVEKLAYVYAARKMQKENIKPKNNRQYWVCHQMFSNGQIEKLEIELKMRGITDYSIEITYKK